MPENAGLTRLSDAPGLQDAYNAISGFRQAADALGNYYSYASTGVSPSLAQQASQEATSAAQAAYEATEAALVALR